MHSRGFQSPTGNIRCATTEQGETMVCETMNDRHSVELGTVLEADDYESWNVYPAPTLEYGNGWWSRNFYCWSLETGVKCRSLFSRQGFKINRDGWWYWRWTTVPLPFGSWGSGSGGGNGYTVVCADGWGSHSGGIQGACSSHGGYLGPPL
jgi:hypothetical protein